MNVPKIRFNGFNEEWQETKLCDIAKITMGQSPNSENYTNDSNDTLLIQGNADLNNGKVIPRLFTKQITKTCDRNDIIMTVRAPVGDIAISEYNACIGRGVCSIKSSKFVYHYLDYLKMKDYWKKISKGSTIDSITSDDIKSLLIKTPNKKEEEKIIKTVDLINKKIELQSKKIEDLKLFKLYYYNIIFSSKLYDCFKLGDVVSCLDKKRKPISSELRKQGIYPYYGANGIQDYIDDYIFDGCYVLLAEDGGNFSDYNTKSIAQLAKGKIWVNNHAHVLVGDKIDTEFLFYQLEHMDIRQYINGTSRSKLNQEDMMNILLQIPSIEEQKKISKVFNTIEKKIYLEKIKYEKLTELKKGLMQSMFV